jgi:Flp pilus assembly protein TadG
MNMRQHFEAKYLTERKMRGQGMVEFALMLPIVLLMIYGLMEMARLMQAYLTIQHAAREGARYAVTGQSITGVAADRPSSIVSKARDATAGLQIASSTDTPNLEPGNNPFYLDVSLDPVNGGGATSAITVTVTYNYAPLMPIRFGEITLLPTVVKLQGRAVMITERIDRVTPIAQSGNVVGALYNIYGNIFGVAGVTVSITSGGTGSATTDSSGNYSIASLTNGTYTITPTKTGCTFSPTSLTVTINGAHSTGNNFTSTCSPGYSISGAAGVVGATVTLSGAGSGTATSDGSGNYSFSGLSNGGYTVTPSKTGCTFSPTSLNVTLSNANSSGNNFTATCSGGGTYSISGAVSGASGVTLTLGGAGSGTTTSDGSGNYSFASLSNGSYTVTPSKTGCTFSPTSLNVTISSANSGGNNFTASCSGGATYSVAGTVTGASSVTLTLNTGATTTSDGSGNYSFSGLSDATTYIITPSKTGCTFSPTTWTVTFVGANLTGKDFTCTYTISGNVQTSGGANMSGVTMTLSNGSTTTTNGSGNYSFSGLAGTGTYTVTPTYTGYTFSPSTSGTLSISGPTQNFVGTASSGCQLVLNGTPDVGSSDSKKIIFDIKNNAGSSVTIDKITATWSKTSRKIDQVKIGGSSVWKSDGSVGSPSGQQNSGTELDISNTSISSGSTKTVELKFDNSSMSGATGTVTFTTSTGTTCSISYP